MGIKEKFLGFFGDDIEEEEITETEEEYVRPINPAPNKTYTQTDKEEDKERKISIFGAGIGNKKEEGGSGKMKVSYVSIIRPKTFEDSRLIADSIKERKVVTFSLEFLEFEVGQRVIDFVSGAAYAMDAHLSKVTDKVLTSIPNGIGYEDIDTSLEEEKLL